MDFRAAVLVPTFRRPKSLCDTLASLQAQVHPEPFLIVVADNDQPAGEGRQAAEAWAASVGWQERVRTVAVLERGISQCRNAGLAAALAAAPAATGVAMVDDDATADPGWLAALRAAALAYDADLVGGPVIYDFPASMPDWLKGAAVFRVPHQTTGAVESPRGSGNLLLSRRLIEAFGGAPFDPAFGLSGGEDKDLFERARRAGRRAAWAAEAVVREPLPADRATPEWVARRAYAAGLNDARIDRRGAGIVAAAPRQIALAAKELVGGALKRLAGHGDARQFEGRVRLQVARGRLAGLAARPLVHR